MKKLEYVGTVNVFIPEIGIGLPSGDNIITVTEKQFNGLLRYKCADKPQFKEVKDRKPTPQIEKISEVE